MYKVYDNPIPSELMDQIYNELTSDVFPWYKSTQGYRTVYMNDNRHNHLKTVSHGSQLCHQFFHELEEQNDSAWKDMVFLMLQHAMNHICEDWKVKEVSVLRSKANLQINSGMVTKKVYHNPPHQDTQREHIVLLYYVNDSDGDTIIFDKTENLVKLDSISPKKGRLLVFEGNHYHASSPPRKYDSRIVINTNVQIR